MDKNNRQMVVAGAEGAAPIVLENQTFRGVRKIAAKVAGDIALVTGQEPELIHAETVTAGPKIYVGTLQHSSILKSMENEGVLDLTGIQEKRECYLFEIINWRNENVLVIAGSDKRGTIYGLFHLSELMGVSPLVHFADVVPKKQEQVVLTSENNWISKEPSVKYRGFFINDEWPAFGNWTFSHYGGFTAEMYDLLFETLLRMKGNYLWPAMWTSSFSLDGPGEKSAMLADEYGIVMSNSHHEPCLRHSEEWDLVRGETSIYGNEWNYHTNQEGLQAYWRDGLKRSGKYENIITVGMRGERDSSMLGENATLTENVELLKEIIEAQNNLIRQHVDVNLEKVPRMLALYKEVEAYFYGDETTAGLKEWSGLDGITCMLCEDNFGNLRTLPPKELKNRTGGWGMYYHMDYHGGPVSYEWVNSSYLPKIWHQMSTAYEAGIQDIWIVNVGDLKFQEYPLSYFMDLAYDYDRWGGTNPKSPAQYEKMWVRQQFGSWLKKEQLEYVEHILHSYSRLNYNRKPEVKAAGVYHPVNEKETERILTQVEETEKALETLKATVPEEIYPAFYELVYYPAAGSLNVERMQLLAGLNQWYASIGAVAANRVAKDLEETLERDAYLTEEWDRLLDGKWKGMALSCHIGFRSWNDECCCNPVQMHVFPVEKPRILAHIKGSSKVTSGGDWTGQPLVAEGFLCPGQTEERLVLLNASSQPVHYHILQDKGNQYIVCDEMGNALTEGEVVERTELVIRRKQENQDHPACHITIQYEGGNIRLFVPECKVEEYTGNVFVDLTGVLAIEAEHFSRGKVGKACELQVYPEYGRTKSAVGIYPLHTNCELEDAPWVSYQVAVPKNAEYCLRLYSAPANPEKAGGSICVGLTVNGEPTQVIDIIPKGYQAGENSCRAWCEMVLNQIRITEQIIELKKGINELCIAPLTSAFLLERLVLVRVDKVLPETYLGPEETYYTK